MQLSRFSHVRFFATLWTRAHQAPLSMEFSRPKYWTGLLLPLPEDLPNPGIKPKSLMFPALAGGYFTTSTIWESPGEGNGYPLQYSGLENFMDCIVHGVTKSWTWLSDFHFIFVIDSFYYVEICSLYTYFDNSFIVNGCWILLNVFCICWDDCVKGFAFSFVDRVIKQV